MASNLNILGGLFKEIYADEIDAWFSFIDYTEDDTKIIVSYSPVYMFKARESKVVDLIEWIK